MRLFLSIYYIQVGHAMSQPELGQSHPSNKLMTNITAEHPYIYETHFRFESGSSPVVWFSSDTLSCTSALRACRTDRVRTVRVFPAVHIR
jgi:hypothetical protein